MISIIIPSFNQAKYLHNAIESALDQNVQGEIIIVDDKSTDLSLAIAKKYQDKRPDIIKIIEHEKNEGLATARNTGIAHAKFDWFIPLDADDYLLDNCLERIIEVIKATDADMVAPSFRCFGLNQQDVILMPNLKIEDFRVGNRIGYCTAMRKSKVLEVGGYNPAMVEGYEDMALTMRMLSKGAKLVTIPEVLWMYQVKKESMYTKITPEIHKKLIAQINQDVPEAQLYF